MDRLKRQLQEVVKESVLSNAEQKGRRVVLKCKGVG